MFFQDPASPIMEGILDLQLEMSFHCIYILVLVLYGLGGSIILFNENTHRLSSSISHWTLLERIYSIIPMLSIACIYAPSFSLLYAMDEYPDSLICLKVVGRQWYWHYEISYSLVPDKNIAIPQISNISFDSYALSDYTLKSKYLTPLLTLNEAQSTYYLSLCTLLNACKIYGNNFPPFFFQSWESVISSIYDTNKSPLSTFRTSRLLETSQAILLPTGTIIRALITASDVIHSWAIPSLGIKTDGIPGRLNQVFFSIIKEGIFYGQCSELCGQYHFAMPIVIKTMNCLEN